MIITRLMGGLGNQLFQYAAARTISILRQVPFKLDISSYSIDQKRTYMLGDFNICESFAAPEDVNSIRWNHSSGINRFIFRLFQKAKPRQRRNTFRELNFSAYDPMILQTRLPVYLSGYWQSEKYFKEIGDMIRKDFTIKGEISSKSKSIAESIRNQESVSVHIRRGDYVSDQAVQKVHCLLGLDYYMKAMDEISGKVNQPAFYFFSDDPDWVKQNIKISSPTEYINHNSSSHGYEDLWLMSQCKHHIIANSSFSWWGAWLATDPGKIVCAPQKWFNIREVDIRDLLPGNWIKIDVGLNRLANK
jgi:hypothetical protein